MESALFGFYYAGPLQGWKREQPHYEEYLFQFYNGSNDTQSAGKDSNENPGRQMVYNLIKTLPKSQKPN